MASLGLIDFVIIVEEKGYFLVQEYTAKEGYVMIFEGEGRLDRADAILIEEIALYEIRADIEVRLIEDTIEVTIFG